MEKNKTGKYLKYAVGEIILVVIGILIALQINNWNENRKNNNIRINYYEHILQDLKKDTTFIHSNIKVLNTNIALYENYIAEFQEQESPLELVMRQSKLNPGFKNLYFNANTIESLQSTGDIKLMPFNIRNKLIDLKNLQKSILKATSVNDALFLENIFSAVNLGADPKLIEISANQTNQLLAELKIEENITQMALIINGSYLLKNTNEKLKLRRLNSMLENIEDLIEAIHYELKK